jgi:bifunctional UDP-N-acetylglucosamine pyrophosphorylase/glucosamine-1-phosphate N-acetyltransferase
MRLSFTNKDIHCMPASFLSIIVLAAGKGTRMRSTTPKVLHEIGHRPLIHHVLATVGALGMSEIVVVVAPDMQRVAEAAKSFMPNVKIAIQERQFGTGDAVRAALPELAARSGDTLVLFGDTPLVRAETIRTMQDARAKSGAAIVVLGFRPADAAAYGRLVTRKAEGGHVALDRIVEFADAAPDIRAITLCNSGIFLIDGAQIESLVGELRPENAKREFYLTDIVAIARGRGLGVIALEADASEVQGVNSRAELAAAEAAFQTRARTRAMEEGTTLVDPQTVYFAADTLTGRDSVIGPNVVFGPGVTIGEGVRIEAFCHFVGTKVEAGATVGPFARFRPGADIGAGAHIGNFVEIKKSRVGEGAKVNHLSYIGDAEIGAKANVGAGTITCNYDGFEKFPTIVGAGAFIGSNSSLVAPVTIGEGAYIGAGSVITKDVPKGALALSRAEQSNAEDWAARFRQRRAREKARKESKE